MKLNNMRIKKTILSNDGSIKYYYKLSDNKIIISVLIPKENGRFNYCISSQIGCPNKCAHCATGQMIYIRDLTYEEIFSQIELIKKYRNKTDRILFMGMGEPLLNYDNVIKSCELFVNNKFINTFFDIIVSTCGIIPAIIRLSNEQHRPQLAITIGSANQQKREKIIPTGKIFDINDIINTCKEYQQKTGDKLIFEYPLISKINDSKKDIIDFVKLIEEINCDVHVIPFNEFKGTIFKKPSKTNIINSISTLNKNNINVFEKPSYGTDVYAGCGQLII